MHLIKKNLHAFSCGLKVNMNLFVFAVVVLLSIQVPASFGEEIIIDNGEDGSSFTGTWSSYSGEEQYGSSTLYVTAGGDVESYRFTPEIPFSDIYEVFVWNSCYSNRPANVPHIIKHANGIDTVLVDQDCDTGTHGEWFSLGSYTFNTGANHYLEITDSGLSPLTTTYVGADAARFVSATSNTPPTLMVNTTTLTLTDGEQTNLTATASDLEDGDLTNVINWSDDASTSTALGGNFIFTPVVGVHNILVTVTDAQGYEDTATVIVTVVATIGDRDEDSDGLINTEEDTAGTDRNNPDSDNDGLNDGDEVLIYNTNPLIADTDNDGMGDAFEVENSLNPNVDDSALDPDNDGRTNLDEFIQNTNPNVADQLPATEIIIDNGAVGTSFSGNWSSYSAVEQFGSSALYVTAGGGVESYRFTPTITFSDTYEVFAWNSCYSNRANNVPHIIHHANGTDTIFVDQDCDTGTHGEWFSLGIYYFNLGEESYLEITDMGLTPASATYVGADAARFVSTNLNTNTLPALIFNNSPLTLTINQSVILTAKASDVEDGDITGLINWTDESSAETSIGGNFTFTPSVIGTQNITLTVSDAEGGQTSTTLAISVIASAAVEGNNIYYVDSQADILTELENNGMDLVYSTINYTLPDNIENLTLYGVDPISALGNEQNNVINGNAENNTLSGLAGNDSLYASDGNDILIGGAGNDTVYGGYGNDTYIYELGDGSDFWKDFGGDDSIQLGCGITPENMTAVRDGQHYIFTLADGSTITLGYWFNSAVFQFETLTFFDGTTITKANFASLSDTFDPSITVPCDSSSNSLPIAQDQTISLSEDQNIVVVLTATDLDGDNLNYVVSTQPNHGTLSGAAPNLNYTPNLNYFGPDSFVFVANDHAGNSNTATVSINILPINDAPVIISTAIVSGDENTQYTYDVNATDSDGDTITYGLTSSPEGMLINSITGLINWLPDFKAAGSHIILMTATDSQGASTAQGFTLVISNVNQAPVANDQSISLNEDTTLAISLSGSDADDDALSYTVLTQPQNGTLSGLAPSLIYQPANHFNGTDNFTIKVNDGAVDSNTATISITVTPVNDAPQITSIAPITSLQDSLYYYLPTSVDQEGDALTYSLDIAPAGVVIDELSGQITWLPNSEYIQPISALNVQCYTTSIGTVGNPTTEIIVNHPDLRVGEISLDKGVAGVRQLSAIVSNLGLADMNLPFELQFYNGSPELDDLLGFVSVNELMHEAVVQANISVSEQNLLSDIFVKLVVSPNVDECNIKNNIARGAMINLRVNDSGNLFDSQMYVLNIVDVNDSPVIESEALMSHQAGQAINFQVITSDLDIGDAHLYALVGAPEGIYIDTRTGKITSDPALLSVGSYSFTVTVTDLRGGSTSQSFSVVVDENLAPEIVSTPVTQIIEGEKYIYDVNATDPNDGDLLRYAVEYGPSGLGIDVISGLTEWINTVGYVDNQTGDNEVCFAEFKSINGDIDPVVAWHWDRTVAGSMPEYDEVLMAPIVVSLNDDNNDGKIDLLDTPDIIFIGHANHSQTGIIRALDGVDGHELWVNTDVEFKWASGLAAADINLDGVVEIIGINSSNRLISISHEGEVKWISSTNLIHQSSATGAPSIIDLDQDGIPEIVYANKAFSNSGVLLWNGLGSFRGDNDRWGSQTMTFVTPADILPNEGTEVIVGASVYDSEGNLIWENTIVGDGYTAIGNFNDDDNAEIVVVNKNRVFILSNEGVVIAGPAYIPGELEGGPPTIADFDGDGQPEIGVAGGESYVVFETDLTLKWSSPISDYSSVTGSSVFDFDGNGSSEIVYADELYFRIYDGATGNVIYEIPNTSTTGNELPVVADVDNDGHADIVVVANTFKSGGTLRGIRVFKDATNSWVPTRSIWNQVSYNINNINDDLTVPAKPIESWLTHNTYRLNAFPDHTALALPDLTVYGIHYNENSSTISVNIKNRGLAPVNQPITVRFIHENILLGDQELGTKIISSLPQGDELVLTLSIDGSQITQSIRVELSVPSSVSECVIDNNSTRAPIVDVRVYDSAGLFDTQKFAISVIDINDAPVVTSVSNSQAFVGQDYSFQVEVIDPDKGDAFVYSLVGAPQGIEISEYFGEISGGNLVEGVYLFTIQVKDLAGEIAEQVHILSVSPPDNFSPVINSEAVKQVMVGEIYAYDVTASDPDGDVVLFMLSRSQPGMQIDGENGYIRWTPTLEDVGIKSAEVTAIDTNGASTKQYFLIEVVEDNVIINNQKPVITSLPSGVVYVGKTYEYQVVAIDPDGDVLSYMLEQSIEGMLLSTTGLLSWLPSVDQIGLTLTINLQVSDEHGGSATQSLILPVNESSNHAPVLTSTPTLFAMANQSYSYLLKVIDMDGDAFSITLLQAPNGMSLNDNEVTWVPSSVQIAQNHTIAIRVEDVRGAASIQTFTIEVSAVLGDNRSPIIDSKPNTHAYTNLGYIYDVIARDLDGDALIYNLSNEPAGMVINANNGELRWTPNSSQQASYEITITVSDGQAWTSQKFTLQAAFVDPNNSYPDITSLPSGLASVDQNYTYQLIASDADGDTLTFGTLNAPDGLTVSAAGLLQWTPSIDQMGFQEVVLYVDDGQGRTTQSFTISVSEESLPLTVAITVSPEYVNPGETTTINVFTSSGFGNVTSVLTVDGLVVPLNTYGYADIIASGIGLHAIEVSVTDGVTALIETASYAVRDISDTEVPVVTLSSPILNSIITAPIDILGSVQDDNLASYKVFISPRGQENWQTISEGNTNVSESRVAIFDPTLLTNGQYDVVLYAEDINGQSASDNTVIIVEGDLKVGNFTITLEDLNIPVMGLPIQVTRTYDSRRRFEALDFGYGWSIGYQNVKIEESRTLGKGWALNQYNRGPLGLVLDLCVEPLGDPIVTVTLPTGDVERFEVSASPQCNSYIAIKDVELQFNPVGDTQSSLVALDQTRGYYLNGLLVESDYITPVDPNRYLLETQAGYKYYLNQTVGIEKIIDPNGHTLTYTNDGIFHSSGQSVAFNRDSQGRIIAITDPSGHVLAYHYDSSGDLTRSKDALENETRYGYNANHGLLDIVDPLGRSLVKNIYDENGRLIAQEDNAGNRTDFNHDIDGRQSVITDRRFNTTIFYYDDQGNVTSEVNALNELSSYTYDANGNQLSKINALGQTEAATFDARNNQLTQTDPLGNTVSFTYNQRGQELTIEDARGNQYENTYDSVGNLLSVKDPSGKIAGNNINAQGLVALTQDVEGNTTTYTYDTNGHKLTETDAENNVATFTYDTNGNVKSDSRQRTLADATVVTDTTAYDYDALNRVTKTTYPDGTFSTVEYDVLGNQTATEDQGGKRTEYTYDTYGRLLLSTYPDATTHSSTYDEEGNKLTDTDRSGYTTRYTYDALNRVTQISYADNSVTNTEYDAAGRVVAEIDANNNRTEYGYDAAGRRTSVKDAQGNEHTFNYDADGNLVQEIDARANTTTYTVNALDQKTQTTYVDTSFIQEGFDPLGRRISQTDQANKVTDYSYDGLGRLTKVTDALLQETSFTYDEAGNKLTQTDAELRTTKWVYDSVGRVLSRELPEGQVESFTYDETGNMKSHTDFNNQITTYTYDSNNWVIRIDYHDASFETYTYDNDGNRKTAINSNGTTSYDYDSLNRLTQETQANGTTLAYEYDSVGNKTKLTTTIGTETTVERYTYDSLNRLETVTDTKLAVTIYGYDVVGNRTSVSYPNGTSITYVYDSLNRLTQVNHYNSSGALTQQFDYSLQSTGRRDQIDELSGRSTAYTYDDLYRLDSEVITDAVNGNYSSNYQFDKVGNRTTSTVDGVSTIYAYDDNDRITSQGGTSYIYDDNGNTLTESIDSDITTYTYDAKNKLAGVEKLVSGTTTNSSYTYNADGIRTSQTVEGAETKYVVDSNRDYAQVLFELDSADAVQVQYTYGDDLISQDRAGSVSYYHYDGLGSTRALSNGAGDITDTYNYEAFGEQLPIVGQTNPTDNSYLFTGEQLDSFLGQQYLRARYYDSGIGRFTQQDTYMGNNSDPITLHKYLYASSDPANWTDPTGNFSLASVGAANNVASILVDMQVQSGLSLLDGAFGSTGNTSAQASVRETQMLLGIAQLGAGGFQLLKLLSKKFRDCNSFTEDTLVSTEHGLKRIADINIGDKVWSYNEETGEKSLQNVVHLIHGEGDKEIIDITLMSGEVIQATSGHPFYVNNEGGEWSWLEAGDLVSGSTLTNINGDELQVNSVDKYLKKLSVFNLTVDNDHTYYVGEEGVLSHNIGASCLFGWSLKASNTRHGNRHYRANSRAQAKSRSSGGDAQYWPKDESSIFQMERTAINQGYKIKHSNSTLHAYHCFNEPVGFANGKAVYWLRAEFTGNEHGGSIHGHPRDSINVPSEARAQYRNRRECR